MKRITADEIAKKNEEFPFKSSPQSLTLENEIIRVAKEKQIPVADVLSHLAKFSQITERQIYNYRAGKTDIPSSLVPVFCNYFQSKALAMSILIQCNDKEEIDNFEIVKIANDSCRQTLNFHNKFLEAFEDGTIDGYEYIELKKSTAGAIAGFHLLESIVESDYKRRKAA